MILMKTKASKTYPNVRWFKYENELILLERDSKSHKYCRLF